MKFSSSCVPPSLWRPSACAVLIWCGSLITSFGSSLPQDIVGWWKAEDNALDEQRAHDGETPFGIAYADGVVGKAFDFDSSFSRVSVPDSPAFKLTNAMTLEAWVYPRQYQGFITFRGDNRGGLDTWTLDAYEPGHIKFTIIDETNGFTRLLAPLALNAWQHVAATWDRGSGEMKLYVDGTLVSQTNSSIIPIGELDADGAVGIGNHGGTFHQFPFNGLIDELAIYERALSATEIAAIHDAGSAGKCRPPSVPVITGLIPSAGTHGTAIVIQGSNFSSVAEDNIVQFGAVQAPVTSAEESSITTVVPLGATYGPVTVTVDGLTAYASEFFLPVGAGSGHPIAASDFSVGMNLSSDHGPLRVLISDLDNDGNPDLAAGNVYDGTLSIYRNLGVTNPLSPATFGSRFEVLTGAGGYNPYWIVAADLDGDGRPDLISTDDSGGRVGIRRNESHPGQLSAVSFGPLLEYPVGANPRRVVVFDLNGDAKPEIMTPNVSGSVSILPNVGPRLEITLNSFGAAVHFPAPAGTQGLAAGDVDGDGWADLIVAHQNVPYLSIFRNLGMPGPVSVDSFDAPIHVPVAEQTIDVEIGDVDGDGKLDLITGSYLGKSMSLLRNVSTPGLLGPTSFEPPVPFALNGRAHNAALGDLNGDGRLDIAMATEINSGISVFENLSVPGSIAPSSLGPQVVLSAGWNAWGVSVGDLDLDGRPDLVFANQYDNALTLYRNEMPLGQAPVIVAQPSDQTVNEGDTAVLAVAAENLPLHYQWLKDGSPLSNATNAFLEFNPVQFSDNGTYAVLISNVFGTVTSSNAVLDVNRLPVADASATFPLVLSPNNTNATVVLDGSLSFDPDGDLLTYSWYSILNPRFRTLLGTGVVTVTTLPVGTVPIDLVVSDGLASDTDSITIEVITLGEAAERLLQAVTDANTGNAQSLIAVLRAALASIDRSNPVAAINQLQAFQSQMRTLLFVKDEALATEFIQQAQEIIDSLAEGGLDARNLKALANQSTGHASLEFTGSSNALYIIEASQDMENWTMIGVARQTDPGRFEFEDATAVGLPHRFYRVVTP